jgi:hypothetical protein
MMTGMGKRTRATRRDERRADLTVTRPLTAPTDRIVRTPSPLARSVLGPLIERQQAQERALAELRLVIAHLASSRS